MQVVGTTCHMCEKKIHTRLEGEACHACEQCFHRACLDDANHCPTCAASFHVQQQQADSQLEQQLQKRVMRGKRTILLMALGMGFAALASIKSGKTNIHYLSWLIALAFAGEILFILLPGRQYTRTPLAALLILSAGLTFVFSYHGTSQKSLWGMASAAVLLIVAFALLFDGNVRAYFEHKNKKFF